MVDREKLIALISGVRYGKDDASLVGENFQEGFIARIADHLIANGVEIPVRCEKCFYFIPMDDVRDCPLYKDYPIDMAVDMGYEGLCGNCDKWACRDEFCSNGTEEAE